MGTPSSEPAGSLFSAPVGTSSSHGDALAILLDLALEATAATGAALLVPEGEGLSVRFSRGINAPPAGEPIPLAGTVAGEAWYRGRLVAGAELPPRGCQAALWADERTIDVLAAPVVAGSSPVAIFLLYHRHLGHFRRADALTLTRLAAVAAGLWSGAAAASPSLDPRAVQEAEIGVRLALVTGREGAGASALWPEIARGAAELLNAPAVRVSALEGEELVCVAATGGLSGDIGRRQPRDAGLEGVALESAEGVLASGWIPEPGSASSSASIRSVLAVPIRRLGAPLGVVTVADESPGRFTEADRIVLARIGVQAAVAITEARMRAELERRASEDRIAAQGANAFAAAAEPPPPPVRLVGSDPTPPESGERDPRLHFPAADAIFVLDDNGTITSFNEAAERLWGLPAREAVGRAWEGVLSFESPEPVAARVRAGLAGESAMLETQVLRSDGERSQVQMTVSPLVQDGRTTGVLGIVRDVTDQQWSQAQLLQAEKMAAIGRLVGGMAHEINNPLASMLVNLELLLSDAQPPAERETLRALKVEAHRAAEIVRNLLTYVRGQGSEQSYVDLRDAVRGAVALRKNKLATERIEVVVDLPARPVLVLGNTANLQQVLTNLLMNAEQAIRQARSGGRVWIALTTTGSTATIVVDDDGPGVPPELLTRVFDPFYTTKPEGEGAGLGLSVSAGIVAEHQGRLFARERPGGGARFVVELPLTQRESAAPGPAAPSAGKPARRGRVLLVDDEPDIRRSVAKFLTRAGWQVDLADSGEEGLRLLAAGSYETVLCDLRMPGMSGPEFYRRMQAEHPAAIPRLVFMSGDVVSPESQRFLGEAGRPVLSKPFALRDLIAVLGQVTPE